MLIVNQCMPQRIQVCNDLKCSRLSFSNMKYSVARYGGVETQRDCVNDQITSRCSNKVHAQSCVNSFNEE